MEFQVIVRNRGRHDSLYLLGAGVVLGVAPVTAFFASPGEALGSLVFGAAVGIPLFALALWRIFRMEGLALSEDESVLALFRRSVFARSRLDIPIREIKRIHLGGTRLEIQMKAGRSVVLAVEDHGQDYPSVRELTQRLGVPFSSADGSD